MIKQLGHSNSFRVSRPVVEGSIGVALGITMGVGASIAPTPLYAAAALLGLISLAAIIANSDRGIMAAIAVITLLPFGVIPVPLGGVRLTFLDATLTLLLVVWLLRLLGRREGLRTTPIDGLVVLLIGLAITSFVFGTAHASRPDTTRQFLKMINSLLFFFTAVNLIRTWPQVQMVVRALILGTGLAASIGIVLYFLPTAVSTRLLTSLGPFGYPAGGEVLRYIASTTTLRAISTSVDPNVFGALLMTVGTLGLNEILSGRGVMRRWLPIIVGAMLLCLLLTFSRGSWAGFAVGVAVLMVVKYRRIWLVSLPLLAAAYVGFLPTDQFVSHFISGLFAQDQAAAMRLGEYKDAFRLISEYPVFGVGFGGAPSADLYLGVSSTYLLVAEQMGLLGLLAYVLVMGAVIRYGIVCYRRANDEAARSRLLGLLAAMAAVLVAAILDQHFFGIRFPHVSALVWLVVALIIIVGRLATSQLSEQESETPTDRRGLLAHPR
ncbi:MAG TPA: O-antigen ligase family protein [Chloroflexota bacterium]|nr:O-antigen ligase family protein [Chloroflexota bacterium]